MMKPPFPPQAPQFPQSQGQFPPPPQMPQAPQLGLQSMDPSMGGGGMGEGGQMPQGIFDLYEATLDTPGVQDLSALYENPVADNAAQFDTSGTPPTYEENLDASDGAGASDMGGGAEDPGSIDDTQSDLETNADDIANLLTKKAQDREKATQMFQGKNASANKQRGY